MGSATYDVNIEKKYINFVEYICETYNVDINIDQYLNINNFSKNNIYIINVRKDGDLIDEQIGSDLDGVFDMLMRRLYFAFS